MVVNHVGMELFCRDFQELWSVGEVQCCPNGVLLCIHKGLLTTSHPLFPLTCHKGEWLHGHLVHWSWAKCFSVNHPFCHWAGLNFDSKFESEDKG